MTVKKYDDPAKESFFCNYEEVLAPFTARHDALKENPFFAKALIILFGKSDAGKTTTLYRLVEQCALPCPSLPRNRNGKPVDFRCHFDYNDNHICVTTSGDLRTNVEGNCATFDYIGTHNPQLDICITAITDKTESLEAIDYYISKMRRHFSSIIWLNIHDLDALSMQELGISNNVIPCARMALAQNGESATADSICNHTVKQLQGLLDTICSKPRPTRPRKQKDASDKEIK